MAAAYMRSVMTDKKKGWGNRVELGPRYALERACIGDVNWLIARLLARKRLTAGEIGFIVGALMRDEDKPENKTRKDEIRRFDRMLDQLYVECRKAGQYGPKEKHNDAIYRVGERKKAQKQKGHSHGYISEALNEPLELFPPENPLKEKSRKLT
jgi:hypothetical protein